MRKHKMPFKNVTLHILRLKRALKHKTRKEWQKKRTRKSIDTLSSKNQPNKLGGKKSPEHRAKKSTKYESKNKMRISPSKKNLPTVEQTRKQKEKIKGRRGFLRVEQSDSNMGN